MIDELGGAKRLLIQAPVKIAHLRRHREDAADYVVLKVWYDALDDGACVGTDEAFAPVADPAFGYRPCCLAEATKAAASPESVKTHCLDAVAESARNHWLQQPRMRRP